MPTGLSSTDASAGSAGTTSASGRRTGRVAAARRAVVDVGHLVRFRAGTVRRRRAIPLTAGILAAITLAACTLPMLLPGARDVDGKARDVLLLLPTVFAGFLLLTVVSSVASGGGRELLNRDQGVAFPVSPTTDHLGALLMAPLNIAWLLQTWAMLGSAAYALPLDAVAPAQIVILLWVAAATSAAQIVAWTMEAIRRRRHGRWVVRAMVLAFASAAAVMQVRGTLIDFLDRLPTVGVVARATRGFGADWVTVALLLAVSIVVAVAVGAVPAHLAARRPPLDEARVESGQYAARRTAGTVVGMLMRLDRGSIWRSVPMRRGITVLGVGPGLVAIVGNMSWQSMTILPGLVASGGVLLFGVNGWCLDGRGLLWRESLPARPSQVFAARVLVLCEFLLVASAMTIVLAALRAGVPQAHELAAIACLVLVVTVQVVAAGMRWSWQRPYPVDMRSARATPAPPMVMVGYSTRLALSTTFTGLAFSMLARVPDWRWSVLVTVPFVAWSGFRLMRAARIWEDPAERARVVMTVAA